MTDSPYDQYKDKVKYDYIIQGSIKGKIVPLEDEPKPDEEQEFEAADEIGKQLESFMFDEDYLGEIFTQPGLGRVYGKVDNFLDVDDYVRVTFGVSIVDKREDFTEQDIIEETIALLNDIDSDLDPVTITGVEITGDPEHSTELTMLCFKTTSKATAKVIKEEAKVDLDNIDRTLVTEEKLTFKKDNILQEFKLTDEGVIELYKENKWVKSIPFSKSGLLRECKLLVEEGYTIYTKESDYMFSEPKKVKTVETEKEAIKEVNKLNKQGVEAEYKEESNLTEAEFKDDNQNKIEDPQSTKEELQQEVDDLKEIQGLKQEVDELTDEILDESVEIKEFPSTEFTQKELTQTDVRNLTEEPFTQEQKDWLINKFKSIEEFIKNIQEFNNFISTAVIPEEEPYVNIDSYINYLIQKGVI